MFMKNRGFCEAKAGEPHDYGEYAIANIAIAGLQNKGLIYVSEQGYRLALPLFALWLRQRLS